MSIWKMRFARGTLIIPGMSSMDTGIFVVEAVPVHVRRLPVWQEGQ